MVHKRDTYSWKGQLGKMRSWKVRYEIGKNEVGKFGQKLESFAEKEIFQLRSFFPNFARFFPISLGSFQLP